MCRVLDDKDSGKHANSMPFEQHHPTRVRVMRCHRHVLLEQFPTLW